MTTRHKPPDYPGFLAHRSTGGAHSWSINTGVASWAADTLRAAPFPVARPLTIDAISVEVTTAGGAGVNCLLGVYADDGTGRPGQLVAGTTSAEMDVSTTGLKRTTFTPVILAGKALYWLAIAQESGTQPQYRLGGSVAPNQIFIGQNDNTAPGTAINNMWSANRTYDATLPQTFPSATRSSAWSILIMLETP